MIMFSFLNYEIFEVFNGMKVTYKGVKLKKTCTLNRSILLTATCPELVGPKHTTREVG